jgi:hypothetical protein
MRKVKQEHSAWVIHPYNPSSQEVETERSQVQGQHGLHSETLSEKKKNSALH